MWSSKKTKEFGDIFKEQVEGTVRIIKKLYDCLIATATGNFDEARKHAEDVIKIEHELDDIYSNLEEMLIKHGHVLPYVAEDRHALIDLIDNIADKAEIVARHMKIRFIEIPAEIRTDLIKLGEKVVDTVSMLKDDVLMLDRDLEEAYKLAEKVKNLREEARDLEFGIFEKLVNLNISPIDIFLLKERISLIGIIADKAEEAADKVAAMALKYKS